MGLSVTADTIAVEALEAAGDVAFVWDFVSDEVIWGGNISSLVGDGPSNVFQSGETFITRIHDADLPGRLRVLDGNLGSDGRYECEYRLRLNGQDFTWVHEKGRVMRNDDGMPQRTVGVLRIIEGRKRNERLIEHFSNYDVLTGHLSRNRLRDALENAFQYGERFNIDGAFLLIGIDGLGEIRDRYGMDAADNVIISAGQILEHMLRSIDVIGRQGADRFGIVTTNCKQDDLNVLIERLLHAFQTTPVRAGDAEVTLRVSIGLSRFPEDVHTVPEVLARTEQALQYARDLGGDQAHVYHPSDEDRTRVRNSLAIAGQIERALENDCLEFAFQPIVSCRTRRISYYEALVRMRDNGEVLPASVFVPVAEHCGLIRDLDRWALQTCLERLTEYPDLTLSLNLSGMTVTDPSWLRLLASQLRGREDIANRLILEITETVALEDIEITGHFITTARDLGCKVALDDFGSGHTSFRHMRSLIVDVVKIDRIFVRDWHQSGDRANFIGKLMTIARETGFEIVAEGVEDKFTAEMLASEGVDYLQGWYLGKPMLEQEWLAYYKADAS